jgi:ribosomal protein S18 acetylase RimI-like enzyme
MIVYSENIESITEDQLQRFFVGWKKIPPPLVHLQILKNSKHVIIALDSETEKVIAFITALSDDVMTAYIPLLEVLPQYQSQGIGSQLLRRMFEKLEDMYMIDLLCEASMQTYYEKFGMQKTTGMMIRNMHDRLK